MTLFAPCDSAFGALPPSLILELFSDRDYLRILLLHHMVSLKLTKEHLQVLSVSPFYRQNNSDEVSVQRVEPVQLPTASGHFLNMCVSDTVYVQGARVLEFDLDAENGVVHVLNDLLWVPDAQLMVPRKQKLLRFRQKKGETAHERDAL